MRSSKAGRQAPGDPAAPCPRARGRRTVEAAHGHQVAPAVLLIGAELLVERRVGPGTRRLPAPEAHERPRADQRHAAGAGADGGERRAVAGEEDASDERGLGVVGDALYEASVLLLCVEGCGRRRVRQTANGQRQRERQPAGTKEAPRQL